MPADLAPSWFFSDRRGNRLDSWAVAPTEEGHHLWLRGSDEAARQVQAVAPEYRPTRMPSPRRVEWTHVLYATGALRTEVRLLLELLKVVITLPSIENVNAAIALDWYKNPQDGLDPYSWLNTEIGELVSRGKYRLRLDPEAQAQAGRDLVSRICSVVAAHPSLRQTDVVLDIPGHDSSQVSFGSRMAATVARDTGKRFVKVRTRDEYRPPAKSASSAERAALLVDQFYVCEQLTGKSALIVDDVVRSGESMKAVAGVAVAAGASTVYGICAVRTMRR